jgi:ABC-type transport system involved in multi-copper enzyme maturation permease subunit
METVGLHTIGLLNLSRLTGPIFDKELRVASRRRRYYVLRSLYLLVMALLVLAAWVAKSSTLSWGGSVFNASRMAEVGRTVILTVVWFQFFASQIAAVLFFSNAISEEMNRGTLNVLMTTPITSLQIVMGKLLSKFMLLILVLALSLSTLSIVYIFGGVHWEYILSSFCITLTAVLFVSTLTLFCSGIVKRPHMVIIIVLTFVSVYYITAPSLIAVLSVSPGKWAWLVKINPMAAIFEVTKPTVTGIVATGEKFAWGKHCMLMLAVCALFVLGAIIRLRKSMLTFAFENIKIKQGLWLKVKRFVFGGEYRYPIELKNMPSAGKFFSGHEVVLFWLLIGGYTISYSLFYAFQDSFGQIVFSTYSMAVWMIVFLRTLLSASTAITKEKESRTWGVLLCTSLDNWQLLKGKVKAIYRNNHVLWMVMLVHSVALLIFFEIFINSMSYLPGGVFVYCFFSLFSIIANIIFIIGSGLYLSMRLKSSTAAVIAGLVIYIVWNILGYIIIIIPNMIAAYFSFYYLSRYISTFLDAGVGLLFLWRVKKSIRKYSV